MSYTLSKVEQSPFLSKLANDCLVDSSLWATPSEKLISELPSSLANLKFSPFMQDDNLCQYFLELISNFDLRSDDVFVCSLAKCGSSWLQNIVWLLKNNLDYKTIESVKRAKLIGDFEDRPGYIEAANGLMAIDSTKSLSEDAALKMAFTMCYENMTSPRVIKTHLPIYALPKKIWSKGAKVIYICRNMKDMIVSEYHFWRNFFFKDIHVNDVVEGVINNAWLYSNHIDHVLNFWNVRHLSNILFITYEDLLSNSFDTIKKVSKFLENNYTDEQIKELTEFTSFDNMKKNKSLSREEDVVKMEQHEGKKRLDSTYTYASNL